MTFRTHRPIPDPMNSHGAWVFLFAAIAAGALSGGRRGVEPGLLVGTGFAGGYLAAAAIACGVRRHGRRFAAGVALGILAPTSALALGAERGALPLAAAAALPALAAILLARRHGFLSPYVLVTSLAAIALAAPAAATAGGSGPARAAALFALLWGWSVWRSLRVAASLRSGVAWTRDSMRARGLREAGGTALWSLLVIVLVRAV